MRVLAIGTNAAHFARTVFEDAEIDGSTIIPGKKRKDYDSVLGYMCLQTVRPSEVMKTLNAWVACAKKGGEITLLVPSLEWAAVQILLGGDPNPILQAHLYGANEDHHSGFTMMDLRSIMSSAGVAVTHASTNTYLINEHEAELHTVRGIKK